MAAAGAGSRPAGLRLLDDELARQQADALASLSSDPELSARIADAIRSRGRLLMLGMGASHWTNRIVLGLYRGCGIDAHADVLSDQIRRPSPGERVTLIASQSGASGEVAAYFRHRGSLDDHFGLTLAPDSVLARGVPSLIGMGGPEKAFAATRSIMVTLALHGSILHSLGNGLGTFMEMLAAPRQSVQLGDLPAKFADCDSVYLTGRGMAHSVMEAVGLTLTELARVPTLAMEAGQLIHGPLEALGPRTGLVVARGGDHDDAGLTALAARVAGFGAPVATFDNGVLPSVEGVSSIVLVRGEGLGVAATLLGEAQRFAAEAAALRHADAGEPRRSSKVTDGESA